MHALTLMTLRVLSLTGVLPIHLPPGLWLSIDRRQADLQDLFFNEPWFFIEGCLWALLGPTALPEMVGTPPERRGPDLGMVHRLDVVSAVS